MERQRLTQWLLRRQGESARVCKLKGMFNCHSQKRTKADCKWLLGVARYLEEITHFVLKRSPEVHGSPSAVKCSQIDTSSQKLPNQSQVASGKRNATFQFPHQTGKADFAMPFSEAYLGEGCNGNRNIRGCHWKQVVHRLPGSACWELIAALAGCLPPVPC